MPRVKIELPEQFSFHTELDIYQSHINYGGHLDNALLLTLVSEARARYFKSLGYHEGNIEGVGIIMADAAVQYKSEAFQGETLIVGMAAADFSKKGCDLVWQMHEKTHQREVARGKAGIVFMDYATRTIVPVPAAFRHRASPPDPC
ncbi:MAG: thioesterase family protein [Sterolibacterium sp.]|nr:thioesterase family protein [Sterolibacterium sp.]